MPENRRFRWLWILDTYIGVIITYAILHLIDGLDLWIVNAFNYLVPVLYLPAIILLIYTLWRRYWVRSVLLGIIVIIFVGQYGKLFTSPDVITIDDDTPVYTVMTYNVGNGLASPEKLTDMLRQQNADIVGLQEVTAEQAEQIQTDLADIYPYQVLYGEGIPGKGLLSRFPILEHEQLEIHPGRSDLKAIVDVDGIPLNVFVAHPEPPRIQRTGFHFNEYSNAQIDSLSELAAAPDGPTILLGDFNMTDQHKQHALIRSKGLIDAFSAVGRGFGFTLPARFAKLKLIPFMRIDYIWHTPELESIEAWVGQDAGSDHLPVLARFIWHQDEQ